MTTSRKRSADFSVQPLEERRLLSGPSALWVGQDGHDLVGPYPVAAPDGVQDIHIALSGLPADHPITFADVEGLGGGQWQYNGPWGPWKAAVVQAPGATTADLYIEPDRVETGRPFNVVLPPDHGPTAHPRSKADLWLQGGTADPNLRMPVASLKAAWVGQDGHDLTGPDASVGPDGIQDVHLALSGLAGGNDITSVTVNGPPGISWAYGLNHQGLDNAELIRNSSDPTLADLYFNPERDLNGQTLTIEINYASGATDSATVVAGHTDPNLAVAPAPPLPVARTGVSASWLGQDGTDLAGLGSVRVALNGLPAGRSIVAATLSGPNHDSWVYRGSGQSSYYADPYADPLVVRASANPGQADVFFLPDRDETGATMTLRLVFDDGSMAVVSFAGGAADLGLLAPGPASTSVVARPGDDLNALANTYGNVHLSAGVYNLDQPLILSHPVAITADPGATLLFSQPDSAPPWTAAIKIHASHTTLDGFAVRFAGPIRWQTSVDYGPAVIGTTDNLDQGYTDPMVDLQLTRLDLQSPPPATQNEEAPRLIRVTSATNGLIANNTLKGGTTEFLHGPWRIIGNNYQGTVPGTWAWDAFAGHFTHDLVLQDNTVQPVGPSGRTWRFLVLTGTGDNDLVAGNTVVGIGPKDTDTTSVNAAEIVLNESYSLHFEGKPLAISPDGRIVQIPTPQGDPAGTGDVVAILNGPNAGQWRRIAQAIGPNTYLLDQPLPQGSYDISIASGFVNESYRGNTIDARGSSVAVNIDLLGNSFGTQIVGNHLLGGGEALRVVAYPTEHPSIWGWSHTPILGAVISGNTIEDALKGVTIDVQHGSAVKSNENRVYLSASLTNNTIRWTNAFVSTRSPSSAPPGITVGGLGSIDPDELRLTMQGNVSDVPSGTSLPSLVVNAGQINGLTLVDQSLPVPPPPPSSPSSLSLVHDSGSSASDGLTNDPTLRVGSADRAVSYEYRVGNSGPFLPVPNSSAFVPAGLSQGANTVQVRGIDSLGQRGPMAQINFRLDTTPPSTSPPALLPSSDTGRSSSDGITRNTTLSFSVSGDPGDVVQLIRDSVVVARGGPGILTDPGPLSDGSHSYSIRRIDAAGNMSMSPSITIVVDTKAPSAVVGLTTSGLRVSFQPTAPSDVYAYRVGNGAFQPLGGATSFTPQGLASGTNTVQVVAIDLAGNVGPAVSVVVENVPVPVTGQWLGQDGHDLVGPYPVAVPDGIQDIHIRLSGLPADRAITFIDIQGLGGSEWQYNGPWGPWKAALVRSPGATTADVYLQPDRVETGRPFQFLIRFDDGSQAQFWVNGGSANPNLRMPGVAASQGDSQPATTPLPTAPGRRARPTPIVRVPRGPRRALATRPRTTVTRPTSPQQQVQGRPRALAKAAFEQLAQQRAAMLAFRSARLASLGSPH